MLKVITLLLTAAAFPLFSSETARDIVDRSVKLDFRNQDVLRDYTFNILSQSTEFDSAGGVRAVHSKLEEVMYFGGKAHNRLIARDGKPLPAGEEKKEQAKVNSAALEASRLSEDEVKKREEASQRERLKKRDEQWDIPHAFNFAIVGEPLLNGRPTWQITAEPRPDYKGRNGSVLRNLRATFWIDKQDLQWVKIEAETLDTISFGLFIARIAKGAVLTFEAQRINDEVWAPSRVYVKGAARVALMKKLNLEETLTFSDYKKFRTGATIISISEPK
jgi:hypothetical protein